MKGRALPSRRAVLTGGLATLARPAQAQALDLLLALAVDASGSVSQERFTLQIQGYAEAFRHPRLHRALQSGPRGAIAVTMYQWTGPNLQIHAVPWQVLDGPATAAAFADAVAAAPRELFGGGTSISGAILHGAGLIALAPHTADRRVIDISGDGPNNRGRPPAEARDGAIAAGLTINGLPILALDPSLDTHYRDHVIGGPGAFLVVVEDYNNFAEAILRKLVQEISGLTPVIPVG